MIGKQSDEVVQAINERADIVEKFSPIEQRITNLESVNRVQQVVKNLSLIQDDIRKCFIEDLLIGGTRDWEAFEIVGGKKRFEIDPPKTLLMNTKLIKSINEFQDLNLKPYQYEDEIKQAKEILLKNLDKMSMLAGENISANDVEKFFQDSKFYQYTFYNSQGKTLRLIISQCQRVYVNVHQSQSDERIKTLIHELAHNFSRYRTKVRYIRSISPEFNKNLRQNEEMIEAGDWIEAQIYGQPKLNPDPFSLKIDQ